MSSVIIQLRESQYAAGGGVAVFTHQRPSARNALSVSMRDDYTEMLELVKADHSLSALVITGSGGSFCAGGDIKSLEQDDGGGSSGTRAEAMRQRIRLNHLWMEQLRNLDIPVIAAVDGPAYGAGFSIALAADFIFASTDAVFCASFIRVGLVPDLGASYFLPRVVGSARAKDWTMTARRVSASEAHSCGLVHTIVPPESLMDEAGRFALRFAQAPRSALALTKGLMNKSFESPYATLAEMEASAQAVACTSDFHVRSVNAFLRGERASFDWESLSARDLD